MAMSLFMTCVALLVIPSFADDAPCVPSTIDCQQFEKVVSCVASVAFLGEVGKGAKTLQDIDKAAYGGAGAAVVGAGSAVASWVSLACAWSEISKGNRDLNMALTSETVGLMSTSWHHISTIVKTTAKSERISSHVVFELLKESTRMLSYVKDLEEQTAKGVSDYRRSTGSGQVATGTGAVAAATCGVAGALTGGVGWAVCGVIGGAAVIGGGITWAHSADQEAKAKQLWGALDDLKNDVVNFEQDFRCTDQKCFLSPHITIDDVRDDSMTLKRAYYFASKRAHSLANLIELVDPPPSKSNVIGAWTRYDQPDTTPQWFLVGFGVASAAISVATVVRKILSKRHVDSAQVYIAF